MHAPRALEEESHVRRNRSHARRAGARARKRPVPSGCVPCETCASCSGSPSSTRCAPPCPSRARRRATPARPRRSRACRRVPSSASCANSHAVPAKSWTSGAGVGELLALRRCCVIEALSYSDSSLPALDLLESAEADSPSSSAACSTSSSRLWIALWLVAVTPTRRPRRMRSMMSRAPVHVLPVPGGPWMNEIARVERGRAPRAARPGRWSGCRRRAAVRRIAAASARGCRAVPDSGRRRRAPTAQTRERAPAARSSCIGRAESAPAAAARRQLGPRRRRSVPAVSSIVDDRPGVLRRGRIARGVTLPPACAAASESEACSPTTSCRRAARPSGSSRRSLRRRRAARPSIICRSARRTTTTRAAPRAGGTRAARREPSRLTRAPRRSAAPAAAPRARRSVFCRSSSTARRLRQRRPRCVRAAGAPPASRAARASPGSLPRCSRRSTAAAPRRASCIHCS